MILADKPIKVLFRQDIWQQNSHSLFRLGEGQFYNELIQRGVQVFLGVPNV